VMVVEIMIYAEEIAEIEEDEGMNNWIVFNHFDNLLLYLTGQIKMEKGMYELWRVNISLYERLKKIL
jgi:hypothetical protein